VAINPKTRVQLEDQAIRDAVSTIVGLEMRRMKNAMVNRMLEQIAPQVEDARLFGKSVDVPMLVQRVWKEQYGPGSN
jgi:hypothetical protein